MGASKPITKQNDSILLLAWFVCLTGCVHWVLIVWLVEIKSQSLNTEMKYHWKNGRTRRFRSEQSTLITRDLFTHQVTATFIVFLVFDAFSRFLMALPVSNTGAQATISAVEKWIHSFGIPQSIVLDRGTAFINIEFINWTKELGITLRPPTAYWPWTKGKIETQNQHNARYWRNFSNDAWNNWSSLGPKFAFAQNTSVNYTTGKTPYEIAFGTKPQMPMSLKLGLYRKKTKLCCSYFCKDLPSDSHSETNLKNQLSDNFPRPQLSLALLEQKLDLKRIYSAILDRCREQTARSHAYRNQFKLGKHLEIGQKVLYKNYRQDLSKSLKIQQRRLGPFTVTKRVTNAIYKIQDGKDPTILKRLHRNHLVDY